MGASLHDAALVEDDDLVRGGDCRKSVPRGDLLEEKAGFESLYLRDGDSRSPSCDPLQRILDLSLRV